ncbi:DUF2520 domain-containing protein [bacterium]|nr:DUF2520 domain-containing protein [bacterium]
MIEDQLPFEEHQPQEDQRHDVEQHLTDDTRTAEDLRIGVSLIGAGRVGLPLLRHAVANNLEICAVVEPRIEHHPSIRAIAPDARVLTALPPTLPRSTDVCILAVPDDALPGVVQHLADHGALHNGALVFHLSGLLSDEVMLPLQEAGCHAGCMHPIQSFPASPLPPERLIGIGCGVQGPDDFWSRASDFAELLGWFPIRVNAERKALYHAACVFAGNFTTLIAHQAEQLLRLAAEDVETPMDYLLPMMESVLQQLRDHPAEQVLTGPAARGDTTALGSHMQAIDDAVPDLLEEYRTLTRAAAAMSQLTESEKKQIADYLRQR